MDMGTIFFYQNSSSSTRYQRNHPVAYTITYSIYKAKKKVFCFSSTRASFENVRVTAFFFIFSNQEVKILGPLSLIKFVNYDYFWEFYEHFNGTIKLHVCSWWETWKALPLTLFQTHSATLDRLLSTGRYRYKVTPCHALWRRVNKFSEYVGPVAFQLFETII